MNSNRLFALIASLGSLGVIACGTSDDGTGQSGDGVAGCAAGSQIACACTDGSTGVQQCLPGGQSFSACACNGSSPVVPGGGAGVPGPGAVDPGAVDPGAVDPGAVDPGAVDPGAVDPGAVDPGAVDPPPPVDPPAANETEFVFETGQFSVPPGGEVYKCQDFPNPFGKDIGIVQSQTELTSGSHHMFAFVMPNSQLNLMGGLANCPAGGLEFHDYLTTSATPHSSTAYPAGVGRVLNAGDGVRLMVHLLNVTPSASNAFVKFTVRYVDPADLQYRAGSIFLNNVGIRVPPGQSTQSSTYTLANDIWVLGAGSHMHSRGVHFVATTNTGETLTDETDWEEPGIRSFDPPLKLNAGTAITWACTYQNESAQTLTFGESAASNEMCIFPGEFYNQTGNQITSQSFF